MGTSSFFCFHCGCPSTGIRSAMGASCKNWRKTAVTGTSFRNKRGFNAVAGAFALGLCLSSRVVLADSSASTSGGIGQDPSQAWRETMMNTPRGGSGCFEASAPDTTWRAMPCSPAVQVPTGRRPVSGVPNETDVAAGDGTDYFGVARGTLSQAAGTFQRVSNVTSISGYSIQINSNAFSTAKCNNHPNCFGWQQFFYSNSTFSGNGQGSILIEWTLFGYGTSSPGAGWTEYPPVNKQPSTTWFLNSSVTTLPSQSISTLSAMRLIAIVNSPNCSAGNDEVTFQVGSGHLYTNCQTDIGLGTQWTTNEFGVFGDGNNSNAQFNNGATIGPVLTLSGQSIPGAPTCATTDTIITTETNNLQLVSASCCPFNSGGNTGFSFLESNVTPLPAAPFCLLIESIPIISPLLQ
jgi:hypothetical protein